MAEVSTVVVLSGQETLDAIMEVAKRHVEKGPGGAEVVVYVGDEGQVTESRVTFTWKNGPKKSGA